MQIDGWTYYNHAAIPVIAPHETPPMQPIENGKIWGIEGRTPLLARWTTEFDCGYETNWWYVIKDTPFDISVLKAKRRYEITKGQKNFRVEKIDPKAYGESLFKIQQKAYAAYPEKYRPTVEKETFFASLGTWEQSDVFGAFYTETNELAGYARLQSSAEEGVINFISLKTIPAYEKYAINAALVAHVMDQYHDELQGNCYICDGMRNMNHETGFQEYLEKYFGFRKAYCRLHVVYNPKCKWLIKGAYLKKPHKGNFLCRCAFCAYA